MRKELLGIRNLMRLLAIVLLSVVLAACGSEDGDDDPTATSAPAGAQPTVAADEETPVSQPGTPESTSAPTNTDMSAVETDATPTAASPGSTAMAASTPLDVASVIASPMASPAVSDVSAVATPATENTPVETGTPDVAPAGGESIPADTQVGDGTTGAIVPGTPEAPGATPASTPVASASPVAGASPVAALVVTGCEVADVPPFTGDVTAFTLTTDLNFRTGPGPDCDLALPQPIGAFQVVEVTGGPVVREDDGSEWVQIQTLDTTGWVAFEFLEPVED